MSGLTMPDIRATMKDSLRRIDLLERRLQRLQEFEATRLDSFVVERSTPQDLVSSLDSSLAQYVSFDGGYRTPSAAGQEIATWTSGDPTSLRMLKTGMFLISFVVSIDEDDSGKRGGARYADICINATTNTPTSSGPLAGNNMGDIDVHLSGAINQYLQEGDKLHLRILQNSGFTKQTGPTPPPTLAVQFISPDIVSF